MPVLRVATGESLAPQDAAKVATAARQGEVVAFPTDTVYGLGTSADSNEGRERVYALKGRDLGKALPLLVHSAEAARPWVEWTPAAEALAGAFWPGALTLALKPTPAGRPLLSPGQATLALRVPDHPVARDLLQASRIPWATTSANLSGQPALADGAAVAAAFAARVAYVIDAGPSGGKESTVVEAWSVAPRILRPGALSPERLRQAWPGPWAAA